MVVKYLWSNNSVCEKFEKQKKPFNTLKGFFCLLSHQDSNLDRQNQKLQCYHYTIRQSLLLKLLGLKRCKGKEIFRPMQYFAAKFGYLAIKRK